MCKCNCLYTYIYFELRCTNNICFTLGKFFKEDSVDSLTLINKITSEEVISHEHKKRSNKDENSDELLLFKQRQRAQATIKVIKVVARNRLKYHT
ncbi:hypothetical protein RN001_004014 [Aquatica leii]|uniref:Uncharacterized protein n=1 Tax=Aquatica leii TaxID=1421715 RepID=A0AAN7SRS7_9COLE|nr:hypothetical protein RN001_004014 [Aquatica leii]